MMNYYCNECKIAISNEEFFYSMNKYKKPLCKIHQKSSINLKGSTKELQSFIKKRHTQQENKELPEMRSIKDWINADVNTWGKAIKKDEGKK